MSHGLDFRKQIFTIKEKGGLTFHKISERFGISIRTLFKWKENINLKDFNLIIVRLFKGNINANVFVDSENSLIVMDNTTFHKRSDSIAAIEKRGHYILFLPRYRTNLNPKWAQAKVSEKKFRSVLYQLFSKFVL